MTSSETPTDGRTKVRPTLSTSPKPGGRPLSSGQRAAIAAGTIVLGAIFIAWSHNFHITASVIVMTLGWGAAVWAVYALLRIGSTASEVDPDEAAWWQPTGKRDELEREKRSLLKTIKEIEFDREMGKLSDADAADILRRYRSHAIEVIKALDLMDVGSPGSVRDEIEREVKARLAVTASRAPKRKAKPGSDADADAGVDLSADLARADQAAARSAESASDDAKESAS